MKLLLSIIINLLIGGIALLLSSNCSHLWSFASGVISTIIMFTINLYIYNS